MKYSNLYFIFYGVDMTRHDIFRQDIMDAGERFADTFSLPKDMVINATLLHMVGKSDIFVENFKGIISYNCHEIIIKGYGIKYCICGENMTIEYYSNEDMKISGRICEVKVIMEA